MDVDLAREFSTSMKTRNGAIALSAPMNTSPKADISRMSGTVSARMTPITSPATILSMRLIEFHFS